MTACKSNLKNLATALEMYAADNAGHYPNQTARLLPKYLRILPTCPSVRKDNYSGSYQVSASPDNFSLCCLGRNHSRSYRGFNRNDEGFPQYNGSVGLIANP